MNIAVPPNDTTAQEDEITLPAHAIKIPVNAAKMAAPEAKIGTFDYAKLSYQEIRNLAQEKAKREGIKLTAFGQEPLIEYLNKIETTGAPPSQSARPEDGINHAPARNAALDRIEAESYKSAGIPMPQKASAKTEAQTKRDEILARIEAESNSRVDIDRLLDNAEADQYSIPPHMVPEGFSVEFKNTHVMGQPVDDAYNMALYQGGWMPAESALFPELVPPGYTKQYIERPGMILMIRPKRITDAVHQAREDRARAQMGDKIGQMGATQQGQMDRVVQKINRSYEAHTPRSPVPE